MSKKDKYNLIKKYILSIIIIAFCGEMYFFPFQGAFRFSLGVIALNLILLLFDDINELILAFFTSISILFLRAYLHSIDGYLSIYGLFMLDFPASIYYLLSGTFFYFLDLRVTKDNILKTIYLLSTIDISSNIVEALLRNNLNQDLFYFIVFIGLARSCTVYFTYYILKRQEKSIKKIENQKKFDELNTLISNIQAEIFYLNKSTSDIEVVMSKAYMLYEKTKDNSELNNLSLDVAREVHEIKKDYYRIINGFKTYIDNFEVNQIMSLNDISSIIKANLGRYIKYLNKNIEVNIVFYDNVNTKNYYFLFTIINNLITNAIDAIDCTGTILVEGRLVKDNYIIKVVDNGSGIDEDLIPHIFNPGFTTKFDSTSGAQSTGIGLSHIDYIVSSLDGNIEVKSEVNKGTSFMITLPLSTLGR